MEKISSMIDKLQEVEEMFAKMARGRIALIPEYEGGWRAEAYGEDSSPVQVVYGMTPTEALGKITKS